MKSIYTLSQTPIIITDLDGTILVDGKLENEVINTFKKIQSMGIVLHFQLVEVKFQHPNMQNY